MCEELCLLNSSIFNCCVCKELVDSWKYFDIHTYMHGVLMKTLKSDDEMLAIRVWILFKLLQKIDNLFMTAHMLLGVRLGFYGSQVVKAIVNR